ncbi:hypothetical protein [Blautia argi]|uniref:hypothetical protein n=1 Tax=Blautia argi TaxID=1912897 RepID=UPI002942AC5D|nr:hypothetical protein [Blautia argi]
MSDKNNLNKINYGPNCLGNVIRILDNRTLIVNAGKDVLSKGNTIAVYVPVEPIYDLDGTELAIYEHIKDVLKVIAVNPTYSICQKQEMETIDQPTISRFALSPLLEGKKEYVPLNVDDAEISPFSVDEKIHVGDPIKIA